MYTTAPMRADRSTLVGVALLCFANLLLSVLVTRLFSAQMFYHFTFMAVGLAMFGIAASGVYVFLNAEKFKSDLHGNLAKFSRWFAAATLLALIYTVSNPIFPGGEVPAWSARVFWQLVMLIVATALPFYFAGVVVSLALTFFKENVNRVYFFDLAGAACAALLGGVVIGWFGGTTAVLLTVVLALVASSLFERRSVWTKWGLPALAAGLMAINLLHPIIRVGAVKWESTPKFEKWNAFSRVTVDKGNLIKIDAGAATQIHSLADLKPGMEKSKITALALSTWGSPPENVLIIGPGGGRDVLFALASGAKSVTGVEINPIIADRIMRGRYYEKSGRLYGDPRVQIVVDEGRSFVSRTEKKYDMIQASLVDTWAATAAGAFSLTENTLYTIEAFEDYYNHLTDRGVVTMTRFYGGRDGEGVGESPRLVILASGALQKQGVKPADVRKHLYFAIAHDEPQGTLIVKKTPFTPDELHNLDETTKAAGFTTLLSPTTDGTTILEKYVDQGAWSDLVTSAKDELTPPTDDRPFFFFFTKFGDLFKLKGKHIYDSSLWVVVSLGTVLALGFLFIVLPLVIGLARRRTIATGESRAGVLTYFGLVGFAFMAIEIALMQRFTLFLGHPTYSLLVILFVVLLATATGSRLSERFATERLPKLMLIGGLALAAIAVIYGLTFGDLLRALIGLDRPFRILLTGVFVAPCGLLMGVMIPSIIRILGAARSELVPWGWGVNGATSVIGTSVATIVAMYVGFTAAFIVGAVTYAAAGAVGILVGRKYLARIATKPEVIPAKPVDAPPSPDPVVPPPPATRDSSPSLPA
jgi:hypothetical protein